VWSGGIRQPPGGGLDRNTYCTQYLGLRSVLVIDNASTHRNRGFASLLRVLDAG
jgi:hypothetical protein